MDPQIKAWVSHCACVVKTTSGIGQGNQKTVLSTTSMNGMLLLGASESMATGKL